MARDKGGGGKHKGGGSDDSGSSKDGRRRDETGPCPLCNGSGEIKQGGDGDGPDSQPVVNVRCTVCRGSGKA
jgi:hypothetical protein